MNLLRYFYTLRHLKPVQFYSRLWFRLYRPRPDNHPAPPLRRPTGAWQPPPQRQSCWVDPNTFCFLNETHTFANATDWNNPAWDKLWLYNLHYFDDLNAEGTEHRTDLHRALIHRWIADNPPGHGNGWESYPLSLRIVNWIQWALSGHELEPAVLHSLAIQVRYLSRRLEYHLLGNHLFANAKALVYAGLFFVGNEAEQWLHRGLRILAREVPEQILNDGGHFERSPMYHAIILNDLLDMLKLTRVCPERVAIGQLAQWQEAAHRMLSWLEVMTHPDGDSAFFNDTALAIAPTWAQLADYAQRVGLSHAPHPSPLTHLPESGYIRWQSGAALALLDVALIGPDYLPGHAHADTLSFELSLFGQRLLVNSGTSSYGVGPQRQRQRSTAAHNTMVIDGQDSSEVWGGFRVARRAYPRDLQIYPAATETIIIASHDGYQRLPGRVTHQRQWTFRANSLTITDHLTGCFREAIAYYHFHPAVTVNQADHGSFGAARLSSGETVRWRIEDARGELCATTYHPRFGVSQPNSCLTLRSAGSTSRITFTW
ncbi:MAG: alginate lyase family protein [Candidatus Competibacteraceae bacterium]